jgi:ribosomal protein S27AE
MTTRLACRKCHVVGFVRVEREIKGSSCVERCECGKCGHVWIEYVATGADVKGWGRDR